MCWRTICVCAASPFPVDPVSAEASLFPGFNRTFNWDMKVDYTHTFQLDFPDQGMRQIPKEETCPDEHTYIVVMYLPGISNIGTFCRGGPVTSMQVRFKGRVSLQVPAGATLDPFEFNLSNGPETNSKSRLCLQTKPLTVDWKTPQ